jgi:hypothetical protein
MSFGIHLYTIQLHAEYVNLLSLFCQKRTSTALVYFGIKGEIFSHFSLFLPLIISILSLFRSSISDLV